MRDKEIQLWNNYKLNNSKKSETDIIEYVNEQLVKSRKWFIEYYSKPEVHEKFKNKSNPTNLINGLHKINVITNLKPSGGQVDDAWGWIYTFDLYSIYINFYNFFNGRIDASVYETIVHEMGHLVDFQLRALGEKPSYMEESVLIPKGRVDEYIISREEDYARIQRLRNLLDIHPFETHEGIGDAIMELVNDGKMYVPHLSISLSSNKKKLVFGFIKKIPKLGISDLAGIMGGLIVNEYMATDIGYLFAKYGSVSSGKIEVDLEKISKINSKFVKGGGSDKNNLS